MSSSTGVILLVEDNEDDVFLMKRALKAAGIVNPLLVAEDGQEAIDYFLGAGKFSDPVGHPIPAVVFLDLKLPIKKGLDVLVWIREQPELKDLTVIVLTSSSEPSDLSNSYRLGANSYLTKPPTPSQIMELAKVFKWDWLRLNRFEHGAVDEQSQAEAGK